MQTLGNSLTCSYSLKLTLECLKLQSVFFTASLCRTESLRPPDTGGGFAICTSAQVCALPWFALAATLPVILMDIESVATLAAKQELVFVARIALSA
jgi:hypothetical protein